MRLSELNYIGLPQANPTPKGGGAGAGTGRGSTPAPKGSSKDPAPVVVMEETSGYTGKSTKVFNTARSMQSMSQPSAAAILAARQGATSSGSASTASGRAGTRSGVTNVGSGKSCPKGSVGDGKGGCVDSRTGNTVAATSPSGGGPVVTAADAPLVCPAGQHLNKPGTACLVDVVIAVPDGTTTIKDGGPTPDQTPQVVTPPVIGSGYSDPNSGGGGGGGYSSGGGSYGGPSEPQYAPPDQFTMPDVGSSADPATANGGGAATITPGGVLTQKAVDDAAGSTWKRQALYVGGALAIVGVGYGLYTKFSSKK